MPLQTTEEPTSEQWVFSRHVYGRPVGVQYFLLFLAVITPCSFGIDGLFISGAMVLVSYFLWKTQGTDCNVSYFPGNELIRIEKGKRRIEIHLADVVSIWQGNRGFYKDRYDLGAKKYHTPFAITLRRSTIFGKEISFTVFEEDPTDMENVRKFKDKVILKRHEQAMAHGKRVREERDR